MSSFHTNCPTIKPKTSVPPINASVRALRGGAMQKLIITMATADAQGALEKLSITGYSRASVRVVT